MKNFAITGVAGYIAPRHLQAIRDTSNRLVAAVDPHDSVGILDKFFPEVAFFTEYERFDRHLEKLRRGNTEDRVEYISICSPNNLHDAHIRLALRIGANAICEKPLVLNPWNLDALQELELETGCKVNTVLQLRVHPSLAALKNSLRADESVRDVCLTYVTARGVWYQYSWKGSMERSGGLVTNIGIHFFDLLLWLFGSVQQSRVYLCERERVGGYLELQRARVRWFLSIREGDLPDEARQKNQRTYRSITVNGEELEFTEGFTDLHTRVYEESIAGRGFGIDDARPSIELAYALRNPLVTRVDDSAHPYIITKS
jgi:UDP-N-acetyl-2-amino-2-deoxyglucuronate dehydrogenase